MTKPWSQGGRIPEPDHWPEWKAAARTYLSVLLLCCLGLWLSGFRCARYLDHRPDPALAHEAARTKALQDTLREERTRKDSLGILLVVAQAHLAVDSAKSAALHDDASRREAAITIDTSAAPIALWPAEDTGSSLRVLPPDTVRFADVQRPNDPRHYPVPKFFTDTYLAQRADRNGLLIVARDQQEVIQGLMAKAAVGHSMQLASDSVNASLTRQVDVLQHQRGPWCQFKCGVMTAVALGVALHYVVKR